MVKIGIIGASGYTGAELIRLLHSHKKVKIAYLTSETYKGQKISRLYPNLLDQCDLELFSFNPSEAKKAAELFFVALPHGESQKVVPKLFNSPLPLARRSLGVGGTPDSRLIDLSGDFRLKDKNIYEKWYGISHNHPELLGKAVYGLPEINRENIKQAEFVTNPGCYPTGVILALAPLLREGLVFEKDIIADSKSGVSGAGRNPTLQTHFPQVDENTKAYSVGLHKHTPEMEQELTALAEEKVKITFTPHLIPMNRGILSTCYADLKEDLGEENILRLYHDFYKEDTFVKVLNKGEFPETKHVLGSNYCYLGLKVDERTGRLIIISAIDNLVKGAAGQAVQNMNLMLGFSEEEGLKSPGLFP